MMEVLRVDATDDSLDEINEFLGEKAEEAGGDPKALFEIELAVEEICVNVFSYAYIGEPTDDPLWGKLEVRCEVVKDLPGLKIMFVDAGKEFDPLKAEEADTTGKMFMEKVGGFGIHMVKQTMNKVEYEYKDGKNILTIQKNF